MHIVAVTGYNAQTNSFIINDPARLTPIEVSAGNWSSSWMAMPGQWPSAGVEIYLGTSIG